MPCQGPTDAECAQESYNENLQDLIKYILLNIDISEPQVIQHFMNLSGYSLMQNFPRVEEWMCDIISNLSDKDRDNLVYNAKCRNSRNLANWWEEHTNHDLKNARQRLNNLDSAIKDTQKSLDSLNEDRDKLLKELEKLEARK